MESENISIELFSSHYGVDAAFVSALGEVGLIEIIHLEQGNYIAAEQMSDAEKMIRIYLDLEVNTEGIDIIMNLLQKIRELQSELLQVKNRLKLYED